MINTPLFQTKGTHHFMTTKFVGSFQMHGLEVTELIDFDHVDLIDLCHFKLLLLILKLAFAFFQLQLEQSFLS